MLCCTVLLQYNKWKVQGSSAKTWGSRAVVLSQCALLHVLLAVRVIPSNYSTSSYGLCSSTPLHHIHYLSPTTPRPSHLALFHPTLHHPSSAHTLSLSKRHLRRFCSDPFFSSLVPSRARVHLRRHVGPGPARRAGSDGRPSAALEEAEDGRETSPYVYMAACPNANNLGLTRLQSKRAWPARSRP